VDVNGPAIGELWTTMGGDIVVKAGGTLIVHNSNPMDAYSDDCAKAVIKSGMGGKVKVASGASFMLYGNFECACINNAPLFEVANRDNVTGNGFIALVDDPEAGSAGNTPNDFATLKTMVQRMISESSTQMGIEHGWGEQAQAAPATP